MVVEGEGEGGKPVGSGDKTEDGLAEYRLDEYDDDVDEQGAPHGWVGVCVDTFRLSFFSRNRSVFEHQGVDVLSQ